MNDKEQDLKIIEMIFGQSSTEDVESVNGKAIDGDKGEVGGSKPQPIPDPEEVFGKDAANEDVTLGGSDQGDNFYEFQDDARQLGLTTMSEIKEFVKDKPIDMSVGQYLHLRAAREGNMVKNVQTRIADALSSEISSQTNFAPIVTVVSKEQGLSEVSSLTNDCLLLDADQLPSLSKDDTGIRIELKLREGKEDDLGEVLNIIFEEFMSERDDFHEDRALGMFIPTFYYVVANNQFKEGGVLLGGEHFKEAMDQLLDDIEYSYSKQ